MLDHATKCALSNAAANPARSVEHCDSRIGRANVTDQPSSLEVHGD